MRHGTKKLTLRVTPVEIKLVEKKMKEQIDSKLAFS